MKSHDDPHKTKVKAEVKAAQVKAEVMPEPTKAELATEPSVAPNTDHQLVVATVASG